MPESHDPLRGVDHDKFIPAKDAQNILIHAREGYYVFVDDVEGEYVGGGSC